MNWRFFIGAAILGAGLMLKVAPAWTVAVGLTGAALVNWSLHHNKLRSVRTKR